jgi:hypothetical protein
MGPRFGVRDLAPLTESKFTALEADALKRLGMQKTVYLESVTMRRPVRAAGWRSRHRNSRPGRRNCLYPARTAARLDPIVALRCVGRFDASLNR